MKEIMAVIPVSTMNVKRAGPTGYVLHK